MGKQKPKRVIRYAQYMRSAAWKKKRAECIAAAGGQCQADITYQMTSNNGVGCGSVTHRCPNRATDAHHLTYARFRDELPEDLQALCEWHHDEASAQCALGIATLGEQRDHDTDTGRN